jgi:hypothetical protein
MTAATRTPRVQTIEERLHSLGDGPPLRFDSGEVPPGVTRSLAQLLAEFDAALPPPAA